ncbi:MAG: 16S rRNA (adenine(1518)-N(6)/adenine(1519)-N(6))-dimethyltransferase RsmA [Eggerthellaceae bacterium]|nr:16S rRNA (adenine(1518)-N(6)/adenine(1519)-N(6))-dimethyltransferase RsmA [Eggerthellaceae bacterium]
MNKSLASVNATREVLERHGLYTKHSLGQNFLISESVLIRIAKLADLKSDDVILEVGPGIGTLSKTLLDNVGRIIAVERDKDLPVVLEDTLAKSFDRRFFLIQKDALDLTEDDILSVQKDNPVLPGKFVANLPYAVAATLVLDYFERFGFLESATVMVQKEVADRMSAAPGSKTYGAYTVKLNLYARPVGRFAVGPDNFFPKPHVESSVIRFERVIRLDKDGNELSQNELRAASIMADAAFASRRKTISNSCRTYFAGVGKVSFGGIDKTGSEISYLLPAIFNEVGIDAGIRGEALGLDTYISLGQALLKCCFKG